MYTKFNEELKLNDSTEYICVFRDYNGKFRYSILAWYENNETVGKIDFEGMGFYIYENDYGYCKVNSVIAYKNIEEYIE